MVSKLKVAHCIFTCLSLTCGIAYSVISSKIFDLIFEKDDSLSTVVSTLVWMVGFAYIIPSGIGVIAALVRKKIPYVIQASTGYVAIGVLIALFFRGLVSVGRTSGVHFCEVTNYECTCGSSDLQLLTTWYTCEEINYLVRMGVSSSAMFWGGGVITFIASVLASVLARTVGPQQQRNTMSNININSAYTPSETTSPYSPYSVQTSAYSHPDPYSQTKTDPFGQPPTYTASAKQLPPV